jgi:hypothetical protein
MDEWLTGQDLETGILGQIAKSLGAPAEEVMVGFVFSVPHLDGLTRHHQNEQTSRADFVPYLTERGKRIPNMLQGVVGNYAVIGLRSHLGQIRNRGQTEIFSRAASLRVDLHAKFSATREAGQKPASPAAKIENIQLRRKPFLKFDPVGPPAEFPDGGMPV